MSLVNSRARVLEIACFNKDSAVVAAQAGADRIELCQNYHLGGLSADTTILRELKSQLIIPIYTMIRPHAHHFCYDTTEFEAMKDELISLKSHGADGFVFGILNRVPKDRCDPTMSWIDVSRNKELVRLAEGRPCTFHRAFDLIPESHWKTALADIMDCGFASILTNGGPSGTKATECVDKLRALVHWRKAQLRDRNSSLGNQVPEIIVGGGVRASNVGFLLSEITDATAFHSAALRDSDELVCESEVLEMKHQTSGSLRTHKNGE